MVNKNDCDKIAEPFKNNPFKSSSNWCKLIQGKLGRTLWETQVDFSQKTVYTTDQKETFLLGKRNVFLDY